MSMQLEQSSTENINFSISDVTQLIQQVANFNNFYKWINTDMDVASLNPSDFTYIIKLYLYDMTEYIKSKIKHFSESEDNNNVKIDFDNNLLDIIVTLNNVKTCFFLVPTEAWRDFITLSKSCNQDALVNRHYVLDNIISKIKGYEHGQPKTAD
jgi:hypothetical protein